MSWRCRICGFESWSYSDVWWHVIQEHGLEGAEIDEQIERVPKQTVRKKWWRVFR